MSKKNLFKLALVIPVFAGFVLTASMPGATTASVSVTQQDAKTGVYVENDTFDFGTISREGDKVSYTFVIHNKTNKPVSLVSVNSSCGCTTSEWTKEPVASGKTASIKAVFNPKGQFGIINKKITATMDSGEKIVMYIKGTVE